MTRHDRSALSELARPHRRIIHTAALGLALFIGWAAWFELDEVAVGQARVVPSSRVQSVQSVEGGQLVSLTVSEGSRVEQGDLLAVLDPRVAAATVQETEVQMAALALSRIRLETLLAGGDRMPRPDGIDPQAESWRREVALFDATRSQHETALADLTRRLRLAEDERAILDRLSKVGGTTDLELLRAQQQVAGLEAEINALKSEYERSLQADLTEALRATEELEAVREARSTILSRTELRAPTAGIVQKIHVSSAGSGVVPPNGTILDIVPRDDALLIEARFSPRDIAFIAPDQVATVKITAYDYAIYGGLEARVTKISPDSLPDEVRRGEYYFLVTLQAERDYLGSDRGRGLTIQPGMVATVELKTGRRTLLSYLVKPLIRGTEALRER